jgi:hypothetical protein
MASHATLSTSELCTRIREYIPDQFRVISDMKSIHTPEREPIRQCLKAKNAPQVHKIPAGRSMNVTHCRYKDQASQG